LTRRSRLAGMSPYFCKNFSSLTLGSTLGSDLTAFDFVEGVPDASSADTRLILSLLCVGIQTLLSVGVSVLLGWFFYCLGKYWLLIGNPLVAELRDTFLKTIVSS
jgi:hypothetical protein